MPGGIRVDSFTSQPSHNLHTHYSQVCKNGIKSKCIFPYRLPTFRERMKWQSGGVFWLDDGEKTRWDLRPTAASSACPSTGPRAGLSAGPITRHQLFQEWGGKTGSHGTLWAPGEFLDLGSWSPHSGILVTPGYWSLRDPGHSGILVTLGSWPLRDPAHSGILLTPGSWPLQDPAHSGMSVAPLSRKP